MPIQNVNNVHCITAILGSSLHKRFAPPTTLSNEFSYGSYAVNILLTFCIGIYISPHISETRRVPNLKLADTGS